MTALTYTLAALLLGSLALNIRFIRARIKLGEMIDELHKRVREKHNQAEAFVQHGGQVKRLTDLLSTRDAQIKHFQQREDSLKARIKQYEESTKDTVDLEMVRAARDQLIARGVAPIRDGEFTIQVSPDIAVLVKIDGPQSERPPHCGICGSNHAEGVECLPEAFIHYRCNKCDRLQELPRDVLMFCEDPLANTNCGCGANAKEFWEPLTAQEYLLKKEQQENLKKPTEEK